MRVTKQYAALPNISFLPETVTKGFTLAPGSRLLRKPFNPQSLLQTVRDCLDGNPIQEAQT